jgi:hypothetical protein
MATRIVRQISAPSTGSRSDADDVPRAVPPRSARVAAEEGRT